VPAPSLDPASSVPSRGRGTPAPEAERGCRAPRTIGTAPEDVLCAVRVRERQLAVAGGLHDRFDVRVRHGRAGLQVPLGVTRRTVGRKVVDLERDDGAVGALHRRGAHVVSLLDVLKPGRLGDRDRRGVGELELEVVSVVRRHLQRVAVDRGDGVADADGRLRVGRGAYQHQHAKDQRDPPRAAKTSPAGAQDPCDMPSRRLYIHQHRPIRAVFPLPATLAVLRDGAIPLGGGSQVSKLLISVAAGRGRAALLGRVPFNTLVRCL